MKDPDAVSLGRRGGLKGGRARAASMTPEQRSAAASHAAAARWGERPAPTPERAAPAFAVYGLNRRGRWMLACGNQSARAAIVTAINLELDPQAWRETCVVPAGVDPNRDPFFARCTP